MINFQCTKENFTETKTLNEPNATSRQRLASSYVMPDESVTHEGTWLQWPHHYQYGTTYRNRIESTWLDMTKALKANEKVHIIAYNTTEKNRIISKLNSAGISTTNIDFKLYQTNDVWVRDNGPIFVKDANAKSVILDFGFNGWGNKAAYAKDNVIPISVGIDLNLTTINLNQAIKIEGGGFEIDGHGVLLATKSCILNSNRNPSMTQSQAEAILSQNVGVSKFIWLDGTPGLEITDMHIDGFAKFVNENKLVTMSNDDLLYWELKQTDINKLYAASNANNRTYDKVILPLTKNDVTTSYGKNLGYKGSYVNYYVANSRILVPNYNDPNDAVANAIIQSLYPGRTVVGIDVRNLYANGGMVHCVTQQQPL